MFQEFNRTLVVLSGSETLTLVTTMLEAISDSATESYNQQRHPDDDKLAHKAFKTRATLVELIAKGDTEAAEDLWRRHLTEAGKVLIGGRRQSIIDILGAQTPSDGVPDREWRGDPSRSESVDGLRDR